MHARPLSIRSSVRPSKRDDSRCRHREAYAADPVACGAFHRFHTRCAIFPHHILGYTPVLHRPQNKSDIAVFWRKSTTVSTSVYFSCTTLRHSDISPGTPLIRKCTTRRWTLWCSHYSVAKRPHFSYRKKRASPPNSASWERRKVPPGDELLDPRAGARA